MYRSNVGTLFLLLYVDEITKSRSNKSRFTKQDEQKASFSKRPLLRKGCTYEYEEVDVRHRRSGHSAPKQWTFGTEEVDVQHRRSGHSTPKQWTFDTEEVDLRHRSSGRSAQKFHSLISHEKMLSY